MKIAFDTLNIDALIQRAVRHHIANTLAPIICPMHRKRLDAVQIGGDSPDRLKLRLEGCCDALLSLANNALGAQGGEEDAEDDAAPPSSVTDEIKVAERAQQPLRAFLCHASEDKALVRRIAYELHANGIDTFFDEWEMRAGDSLRRKIDEGIETCTHFIVVLTPTSLGKPWVNAELDAGFVKKVNGQSVLIPLRSGLAVEQLPPLLRGLLSPEINEDERDLQQLVADIRGITRKPPVEVRTRQQTTWGRNFALSPLGAQISELFARESEDGRSWDPQMPIDKIRQATNASDDDLSDAISELEDLGWVKPQRVIGAPPFGFDIVTPTDPLFEHVDLHVMGWDTASDAARVAAELVNSGERGLQSRDLAEKLNWPPRRLNPALSYLYRELVLASRNIDSTFVTGYILVNPRTRRFVREHG